MRVGIVRLDVGHVYLHDVENSSQRNFSSEPAGQSRYFHMPTSAELLSVLNAGAVVTIRGSNTASTVDTTVSNGTKLNIRTSTTGPYTQIVVTSSATAAKTQLVTDLNAGFATAGLGLVARISGTNQITIDTTATGPTAHVQISASSPSTGAFHTVVGLSAASTTGVSVATLKSAVYPSATTIDVSGATIAAVGSWTLMASGPKAALVKAVADLVAPSLVETGPVLLSFAYGELSKLVSASFAPGASDDSLGVSRSLPAGIAAAVVADDGSTPFVL